MPAAGNQRIRPVIGGIQIAGPTANGTLGLVYQNQLFATAGHVVGEPDSFVGQPDQPNMMGRVIDNYVQDGVDIALVEVLVGVPATVLTIWTDQNTTTPVTFTTELPEEGEILWLQGALSGKISCSVYLNNVDITEPISGQQLTNVVLLNLDVQTQPGDSGAPVVGEGTNACYGVYGGRVVVGGVTYGWCTPFDNLEWDKKKLL